MMIEIFEYLHPGLSEGPVVDISVVYSNDASLERIDRLWFYENDGKSCQAVDPWNAVIGAEGLQRGKVIFNGSAQNNIKITGGGE